MNIGIVSSWCESGAGYVARAYADVLQSQGHSVFIYARSGRYQAKGDPAWDRPNVTWEYPYDPPMGFSSYSGTYIDKLRFFNWLKDSEIDAVIVNNDHSQFVAGICNALGYVVGNYVDFYQKAGQPRGVDRFKEFDFLLCNTRRHYSAFIALPNALYIPWGTNIDLFKETDACKRSGGGTVIFFHSAGYGGTNGRKGTDLLLEAFGNVLGNAKLIIHSIAPLAKYGQRAESIVSNEPRIEFTNRIVPAPGLYHLGDVFVYPTKLEGIGLCVPEALACGLPVITTNNAPMNEFVKDGYNGLLVDVREFRKRQDNYYWPEAYVNIDHLTRQMQRYVDNRGLLDQHKRNARKSAQQEFNWEMNASDLGTRLKNIVIKSAKTKRAPTFADRVWWTTEAQYVKMLTQLSNARRHARRLVRE